MFGGRTTREESAVARDSAERKLSQYDSGARIPATVSAIADAIRWAERIMEEIDRRHPVKPTQQPTSR